MNVLQIVEIKLLLELKHVMMEIIIQMMVVMNVNFSVMNIVLIVILEYVWNVINKMDGI